jgi:hypothetical protein
VFIEDGRHHGPLAVRSILAEQGLGPEREISLGVPPDRRPEDQEADGIRAPAEAGDPGSTERKEGSATATPMR